MAEITANDQTNSPNAPDDLDNGNGALESRGVKRPRPSAADDDDDDDDKPGRERRKIEIKFIQDKSRRHITFSKRKAGIMKKVSHLRTMRPRARNRLCDCAQRVGTVVELDASRTSC
jgi:pheromone receptor transcription factor